jgi:uncharacterized protein (DUF1778 family)
MTCPFCDNEVVEKPHVCYDTEEVVLIREAFERVIELINNPPEQTEAMKKLLGG